MQVPNWQHHSKKDQKRTLRPQALRSAKARVKQFKKCHMTPYKRTCKGLYYVSTQQRGTLCPTPHPLS